MGRYLDVEEDTNGPEVVFGPHFTTETAHKLGQR